MFLLLVAVLAALMCCPAGGQTAISQTHGLNFSPYLDGQSPGAQVTGGQIRERLQIIAPYTKWIRTFSSTGGLELAPAIAREFNLKVAANAFISKDAARNALEIANLVANAKAGLVDIAIVGSEAVLRGDVTPDQLIEYMNQVRQGVRGAVPVTTAEVWNKLVEFPALITASDVVFANIYGYWEGTSANNAVCSLVKQYQQLQALAGAKQVVISEAGWPSAGPGKGAAVPSPENAASFALQLLTWANGNNIPNFYFEAFDEQWKASSNEGEVGAHWGMWDSAGVIKPGMDAYFLGQRANLNCNSLVPGPIAVQFTYVPPYGSGDWVEVQVTGVKPADYVLAPYIRVFGDWWTKPTFATPTVALQSDGTASINIDPNNGGNDRLATDIAVFLIPAGTVPPAVGPGPLPQIPQAVATRQVSRTPSSISGTVLNSLSHPIAGAVISDPNLGSTQTSPSGKYSFHNITVSGSASLTVVHDSYDFLQSPAQVIIPPGNLTVNFTGTPPLPGVPANPSPANGATGVSQSVTLAWSAAARALSYDVYVGTSSPPPFHGNTTATNYSPGSLAGATNYFWKVVAKNAAGSKESPVWTFTTSTPAPAAPALVLPAGGAVNVSLTPTLTWSAASGATSYDIYLGTAPSPPLVSNTTQLSYTSGSLPAVTTHYWRIVAKNAGGSTTSSIRSFVTQSGPPPGPQVQFIKFDTATRGAWKTSYGADGYNVINAGSVSPPDVTPAPAGQSSHTWTASTSDFRALERPGASERIAATWYSSTSFTIDLPSTGSAARTFAVYCLDWDRLGRTQKLEILDGNNAVLNSQTVSNFGDGVYVVWSISGPVKLRVTRTSGLNAVISGYFFGAGGDLPVSVEVTPATASVTGGQSQQFTATVLNTPNTAVTWSLNPNTGVVSENGLFTAPAVIAEQLTVTLTATSQANSNAKATATITLNPAAAPAQAQFVKLDTGTKGGWKGIYGAEGYNVINAGAVAPSYVVPAPAGHLAHTWAATTPDPRGLEYPGGTQRIAATWYTSSSFTIDLPFADSTLRTFAVYCLDWDRLGRSQTLEILDANNTVLNTQAITNFGEGVYVVWNVSGHVKLRVTRAAGLNAVISGYFFGSNGPGSGGQAQFVKFDSATRGGWKGKYGAQGYNVINAGAVSPSFVTPAPAGHLVHTWEANSADSRALEYPGNTQRIAATWYTPGNFTIDLPFSGSEVRSFAVYCLDWDRLGRTQTLEILDANNNVLNSQTVSNFGDGVYLVWNVSGHVKLRVTRAAGLNAVISGYFFGL